jgi:hypothetical protein
LIAYFPQIRQLCLESEPSIALFYDSLSLTIEFQRKVQPRQFERTMAYAISSEQQIFFDERGYLVLRDVMSAEETVALQHWAQEVHDLPRTSESPWMPYEEINASGKRVLCRTENYANYHPKFNGLLRGSKMLGILGQLAREDMLLFKEKSEWHH